MRREIDLRRTRKIRQEGSMATAAHVARRAVGEIPLTETRSGQGGAAQGLRDAQAADMVEMDLGDGLSVFTSGDALGSQIEISATRDGSGSVRLKSENVDDTIHRGGLGTAVGLAVKGLKLIDIDVEAWLGIDTLKSAASQAVADRASKKIDERAVPGRQDRLGNNRPGLYRCDERGAYAEHIPDDRRIDGGGDVLLLLHGFISDTAGSFGGFWRQEGRATFAALQRAYRDRIYCFDHATIGQSPIQNANELVKQLPDGAKLHVLAYSRGGLIGELLSRVQTKGNPAPLPFGGHGANPAQNAMIEEARKLNSLTDALRDRSVRVERFVRVASPVRGTWLASDRLDRWLSNFYNVARQTIPSGPDVLADRVFDLLATVIKARLDRKMFPGIAAMNPAGALMALLNDNPPPLDQKLTVVAGDCVASGVLNRLKLLIADGFFREPHDLVVPTASMFGGAARQGGLRYFFHQTQKVDHFSYFENPETLARIQTGLIGSDEQYDKLQKLDTMQPKPRLTANRSIRPDAPLNFVLPGIMGSVLKRDRDDKLWVDFSDFAFGNFRSLRLVGDQQQAPNPPEGSTMIHPGNPLDYFPVDSYGDLIDYFRRRDELVFPAGYDWRKPMWIAADELAGRIRAQWPPGSPRPLRLIAHSMGGLVARMLFKRHPDLRERFMQSTRNRLLMLGTPNQGSLAVVKTLMGDNGLIDMLDCLAPENRKELLGVASSFPGFLELLPQQDSQRDWGAPQTWDTLYEQKGVKVQKRPMLDDDARVLGIAGRKALFDAQPALPVGHVVYVAGYVAPAGKGATVVDIDAKGHYVKGPGDGTVPYASAKVDGIEFPIYYVDAKHGDLPEHKRAFDGYRELLDKGTTSRLALSPDALRKSGTRGVSLTDLQLEQLPYRPSRGDLYRALLGMSPQALEDTLAPAEAEPIKLQVVHGGLRFARHTLIVGHYQGDLMSGSEKEVDRMFGGQLRCALQLGVYPNAVESFEVFERPLAAKDKRSPFAVVVGLGKPGDLSVGHLRNTVRRGILGWFGTSAMVDSGEDGRSNGDAQTQPRNDAAFSVVLLGTTVSGMNVSECARAILHGVLDAQKTLDGNASAGGKSRQINTIELIELFEDKAVELFRELNSVLKSADFRERFKPPHHLEERGDAGRRLRDASRRNSNIRRLDIQCRANGTLRFSLPGPQAAVPEFKRSVDLIEIDDYSSAAQRNEDPEGRIGCVLFNQLLPQELKRFALEQYDLLLGLGRRSAKIPWELTDSGADKPLAVQAGMIRQLRSRDYAPRERVLSMTALVIGEPRVEGLKPLPDAREEALAVKARLEALGFDVECLINTEAARIRDALGKRPYRIVHFAGHGIVDYRSPCERADAPLRSGMIIGSRRIATSATGDRRRDSAGTARGDSNEREGEAEPNATHPLHLLLLTPEDVRESMLQAPELVFINCCHLGEKGDIARRAPGVERAPALASSLAASFMDNGCRAVVAAGWAVDDAAALTFADTFYRALIDGRNEYIDAVREARKATYERHKPDITWGAYQCYGDGRYTVLPKDGASSDARFVCASELNYWLHEKTVAAMGLSPSENDALRREIEGTIDGILDGTQNGKAWLDVCETFEKLILCLEKVGAYAYAIELIDRRRRHNFLIDHKLREYETRLWLRQAMRMQAEGHPEAHKAREKAREMMALFDKIAQQEDSLAALFASGTMLRRLVVLDRDRPEQQANTLQNITLRMSTGFDNALEYALLRWREDNPKCDPEHTIPNDEIIAGLKVEIVQKQLGGMIIAASMSRDRKARATDFDIDSMRRLIEICAKKIDAREASNEFWDDVDKTDLMVLLLAANPFMGDLAHKTDASEAAYRQKAAEIARAYTTAISISATANQIDSIAAYLRFWHAFAEFVGKRRASGKGPTEPSEHGADHWSWFESAFAIDETKDFLTELGRLSKE
jgi:pimeloyl-ACP methyl ester carboxylesterase